MNKYIISIFISAFLLFQVQPMIAHYILPWFGGTNGVWSVVVLFFLIDACRRISLCQLADQISEL